MKKANNIIISSMISIVACAFLVNGYAYADDWGDAGKVLAGVVGGFIGHELLDNMSRGDRPYAYSKTYYCYPPSRRYVYIYDDRDYYHHRYVPRYKSRHYIRRRPRSSGAGFYFYFDD